MGTGETHHNMGILLCNRSSPVALCQFKINRFFLLTLCSHTWMIGEYKQNCVLPSLLAIVGDLCCCTMQQQYQAGLLLFQVQTRYEDTEDKTQWEKKVAR